MKQTNKKDVHFKVTFNDTIKRFRAEEDVSFEKFMSLLTDSFSVKLNLQNYNIKYTDQDNDKVSVTNQKEFEEALYIATTKLDYTLKFIIEKRKTTGTEHPLKEKKVEKKEKLEKKLEKKEKEENMKKRMKKNMKKKKQSYQRR